MYGAVVVIIFEVVVGGFVVIWSEVFVMVWVTVMMTVDGPFVLEEVLFVGFTVVVTVCVIVTMMMGLLEEELELVGDSVVTVTVFVTVTMI